MGRDVWTAAGHCQKGPTPGRGPLTNATEYLNHFKALIAFSRRMARLEVLCNEAYG